MKSWQIGIFFFFLETVKMSRNKMTYPAFIPSEFVVKINLLHSCLVPEKIGINNHATKGKYRIRENVQPVSQFPTVSLCKILLENTGKEGKA